MVFKYREVIQEDTMVKGIGFGIAGIEEAAMDKAIEVLDEETKVKFIEAYRKEYERIFDETLSADAKELDRIESIRRGEE